MTRQASPQGARRPSSAVVALRSLAFIVLFYLETAVVVVIASPLALFAPRRWILSAARHWARGSLRLLAVVCGTTIEFRGLNNLPAGPFILAHKHYSAVDMLALLAMLERPAFIMKRELAYVPFWGWVAWRSGSIYVSRGKRGKALEQIERGGRRVIADGRPIIIAPEGARRPVAAKPVYKYGVAHLYRTLDVAVVPVALNSGVYWSPRGFLRWPGRIVVSVLPRIEPGLAVDHFRDRLEHAIESECDALLLEAWRVAGPDRFSAEARRRITTLEERAADKPR